MDYAIRVTARDNTEEIKPITIGPNRKANDKCNERECTAFRSVVASIAWIARQVRPGVSYRVSKLQAIAGSGTVKDMKMVNKLLDYMQSTSNVGIHFTSNRLDWDDMIVLSISDAFFFNKRASLSTEN